VDSLADKSKANHAFVIGYGSNGRGLMKFAIKQFIKLTWRASAVLCISWTIAPPVVAADDEDTDAIAEKIASNEQLIASNQKFLAKMQIRFEAAKIAYSQALKNAGQNSDRAQAYFQATEKLVEIYGAWDKKFNTHTKLDDYYQLPGTGTGYDAVLDVGSYALAAAVADRFLRGLEAMEAHDDFWIKYSENYYSNQLNRFQNSLNRFKQDLQQLQHETDELKRSAGPQVVGKWGMSWDYGERGSGQSTIVFHKEGWGEIRFTLSGYSDPDKTYGSIPGKGNVTARQGSAFQWKKSSNGQVRVALVTVNRTGDWEYFDNSAMPGRLSQPGDVIYLHIQGSSLVPDSNPKWPYGFFERQD
jgi:hypothetical protein